MALARQGCGSLVAYAATMNKYSLAHPPLNKSTCCTCWGAPRAIPCYSAGFWPPILPIVCLASYRGHLSWSVFHEQAFCMEVARGNSNVRARTSHTMMMMMMMMMTPPQYVTKPTKSTQPRLCCCDLSIHSSNTYLLLPLKYCGPSPVIHSPTAGKCVIVHAQHMYCRQLLAEWHRHSKFGRRTFSVGGQAARNSLPDYLRDLTSSFDSFRRDLNTFFFLHY